MADNNVTTAARTTQQIFAGIDDQLQDMKLSLAIPSKMPAVVAALDVMDEIRVKKQKLATVTEQLENTEAVCQHDGRVPSSVYSRSESGDFTYDEILIDAEDAKLEAWLARGSRTASSSDSASTLTLNAFPMVDLQQTPTRLSLFPKASAELHGPNDGLPTTPLSPLNNGRDIYGNYISTNPHDYFTARSPPCSPTISPLLLGTAIDNTAPMPRLRGGAGSWWERLGMHSKTSNAPAASPTNMSSSIAPVELPSSPTIPLQNSRIRESIPISAGTRPLTNMLSNYGRTDVPIRGDPTSPRFPPAPPSNNGQDMTSDSVMSDLVPPPRLFTGQLHPPPVGSDQSFTTIASYDRPPRNEKKWDKQPAHDPPRFSAAPPIPKKSNRRSQASSIAGPSDLSRRQRQVLSPDDSYSQVAAPTTVFDVASLQFGESSSNPWAHLPNPPKPHPIQQRLQRPTGMYVSPGGGPSEGEIEKWTTEAENKFRVVAHEIMTRYSRDKAQIWKALQRDEISQILYDRDLRNLEERLQRDLKEAERVTGYDILNDEAAIAMALQTSNGYTIYQDILQPTQPELWTRLNTHPHHTDQTHPQPLLHHRYSTNHLTPGMPFKPPKSSLAQSITVAGKIARFLFAAPAEPELKTFSNRRSMGVSLAAVGGVGSGMTDVSRDKEERNRRKEARREVLGQLGGKKKEKEKVDKGKGRPVDTSEGQSQTQPQSQSGIGAQDFASSASVSRPGLAPIHYYTPYSPSATHVTHAPSNATRYTGTTATPSTIYNTTEDHRLFLNRPYSPSRHGADDTSNAADAATNITSWLEADTQGNWGDARRPVMRGGGKEGVRQRMRVRKERKERKGKVVRTDKGEGGEMNRKRKMNEGYAWESVEFARALHLH